MAIDRPVITQAEFFEEHIGEEQVFCAFLDFVSQRACGLACDFFYELGSFGPHGSEGVVRLEVIEIAGDGTDVLVDRPFVVVEHDDEFAGGFRDVVERFERGAAGEGGIAGDGDDVVVTTGKIARGGHAERGGEGGAGVARAVGVMFGLGAEKKTVEALVGPDRVDLVGAPGEHLVNVALVCHVKDKLVGGGGKHLVQGDGQLHDAKIRPEMPARF